MRQKIDLNDDWLFVPDFCPEILTDAPVARAETVRIPHTVCETPYHYFDASIYQMISGYRHIIKAEKSWKGQRIFVKFYGVAHTAELYLNGEKLMEHRCGYTAFEAELTDHLKYGKDNILALKVNSREDQNIPPFGNVIDYMTYGGIYREVELYICGDVRISDLHLMPRVPDGVIPAKCIRSHRFDGELDLDIDLDPAEGTSPDGLELKYNIREHWTGSPVCEGDLDLADGPSLLIREARLWDPTAPNLYDIGVELWRAGKKLDEVQDCFGFRRSEFRQDGYFLNGRRFKLRGLNRHQSWAYVGYAMPESQQRLDADILRLELGCNAVRTSHYPQSHHFLRRCDELGLLVFTEFPGWQHIGDQNWKKQAYVNLEEMILQYRNHPSIILWGVRINESVDDDEFYEQTNAMAHALDTQRPTGGVRYLEKSHLLEDVYTFNDFSHEGTAPGCKKKGSVTSDITKPYLISEFNGHMFPAKAFDNEELRLEHALRHCNVLNEVNRNRDICGCFGWCMFDYNTHKDFGSGDRICYHGVMDMFRNPKLAAYVYASQQNRTPVLEVSSSMDIGEHPGGNRGAVYIFTNADSVRMYRNDELLKEYRHGDAKYSDLRHPPIRIDDYVGSRMMEEEGFTPHQNEIVKAALNHIASYGMNNIPLDIKLKLAEAMTVYHMSFEQAYALYGKYVGNWGGKATTFRFEAIVDGEVVRTVTKSTTGRLTLEVDPDHTLLAEKATYDVAALRIRVCDEYGNVQPFFNESLPIRAEGDIALIGPDRARIAGGMGGAYVKSLGRAGEGRVVISLPEEYDFLTEKEKEISFKVRIDH